MGLLSPICGLWGRFLPGHGRTAERWGFQFLRFQVSVTRCSSARGATWLGQVISSQPEPNGEFFMTHLLLGGGVPRVHGARRAVPPRLPHFATPWSVRHLATVVAGAYPPRRPPNAWSPGGPAPLGPCYWLVANGTPMGWRGGCLGAELVRSTVGAVPWLCVRGARGRSGGRSLCRLLRLPSGPPLPSRSSRCVLLVPASQCRFTLPAGTPFHAVCAFRGHGRVALRVRAACPLCVCARSCPRGLRPPPPGTVWRAHHDWFWCRALVGPFQAVRAPPRFLPWSRAPARGGMARSLCPPAWL